MGSLGITETEEAMAVSVISKEMVKPAIPTKTGDLYLSCLDILWEHMHYNQRVMFYRTSMENLSQAVETLKQSLSQVLVHYYPWCGRLAKKPVKAHQEQSYNQEKLNKSSNDGDNQINEEQRLYIECNDAGVKFVEASVDLAMSELEKHGFQMMPLYEQLCQHIEPHGGDNRFKVPLLSVQVTRFTDGGLSLGISQSHVVADGQSLWNFMLSWGELARGAGISMEPVLDRFKLPEEPSEEKAKDFSFEAFKVSVDDDNDDDNESKNDSHNTVKEDDPTQSNGNRIKQTSKESSNGIKDDSIVNENMSTSNADMNGDAPKPENDNRLDRSKTNLTQFLFKMTRETIKKLKEESGGKFSSYEVICAHVWKKVTRARLDTRTKEEQALSPKKTPVLFLVLINFRSRMVPPLPPSYFGNAIMFSCPNGSAAQVCEEPLGRSAERLHDNIIKDSQHHRIMAFIHWMELHNNSCPPPDFTPGTLIMNVASSPHFPVYQVDFGWGAPLAVRSAKVPGNGELVLFGGNPNSAPGDVEICMALPRPVLDRLLDDPTFLGTYTTTPFTF